MLNLGFCIQLMNRHFELLHSAAVCQANTSVSLWSQKYLFSYSSAYSFMQQCWWLLGWYKGIHNAWLLEEVVPKLGTRF